MTKIDKHGKYPRAALSLCKWMDKQNIHGEVAYNDPPFPKNNTLFVYLERDEHKDKLPKKWEGLKIVYKGQLPWVSRNGRLQKRWH